jgi:hypothetical protein
LNIQSIVTNNDPILPYSIPINKQAKHTMPYGKLKYIAMNDKKSVKNIKNNISGIKELFIMIPYNVGWLLY